MISVLSLVVTILVAFVAPLVAWEVARQQIEVTAREAWMRDFRAEVAAYLSNYVAYKTSRIAMDGAILVHRAELEQLQIDFGERRVGFGANFRAFR